MENEYRVVYHISNACLFKRHLSYDVKNAMHTRVLQHVSNKHVLNKR